MAYGFWLPASGFRLATQGNQLKNLRREQGRRPINHLHLATQGNPAKNLRREQGCRPIIRLRLTTQGNPAKNLRRVQGRQTRQQTRATDKASASIANFHSAKVWGIFQADSHIFPKYSHIFPNMYIYQLIFNKTVVFLQSKSETRI